MRTKLVVHHSLWYTQLLVTAVLSSTGCLAVDKLSWCKLPMEDVCYNDVYKGSFSSKAWNRVWQFNWHNMYWCSEPYLMLQNIPTVHILVDLLRKPAIASGRTSGGWSGWLWWLGCGSWMSSTLSCVARQNMCPCDIVHGAVVSNSGMPRAYEAIFGVPASSKLASSPRNLKYILSYAIYYGAHGRPRMPAFI